METPQLTPSELFQTYGPKLLALARRQLSSKLSRRVDPQDILQSVFRSFFSHEGATERTADELWGYLIQITLNKVRRVGRRFSTQKRDHSKEEHGPTIHDLLSSEPTSCDVVIMSEELAWLQRQLTPAQRHCLELRLQGFDAQEIAAVCQTTDRTIRRWLRGIGELLEFRQAQSITRQHNQSPQVLPVVTWPAGVNVCDYREFVLEQLLGTGSMCKAFRARRVDSGERVCLKILRQTWRDHFEYRQQLLDEAVFLQAAKHPAIVPLLGAGEMPSGAIYLVLRWIEGQALATYLAKSNSAKVAEVLQEVGRLLTELHRLGITHGDLHAGNVLVGQDGKILFTDFRPAPSGAGSFDLPQRIQADWDALYRIEEYNRERLIPHPM